MNDLMRCKRLNEAFSYVNDEYLDLVELERKAETKGNRNKKPLWAVIGPVAACICAFLLPLGVLAAKWFGLWDLLLPAQDRDDMFLTMYDYVSSPEVRALREWEQFLTGYDRDGSIWSEAKENGFAPEGREDWLLYGVYSFEMGEKLDQITEKYGLALHTVRNEMTFKELQDRVDGSFIADAVIGDCRVYENGSFHFEGSTELEGYGETTFEFHCTVKGTLDGTIPNWDGNPDGWEEWQYDAACGEYTRLSLGASFAMILTGASDRYLMVYMPIGYDSGITRENLQALADKIDFGILKDMQLPKVNSETPATSVSNETLISLSGYMDSPEAQALAEWQEFLAHYDADHKIADALGNGVFVADGREDWGQYSQVYSYEMGEKLDEIAEKYGLKLHMEINVIDPDELMYRVGGNFIDCDFLTWAYIYEDGYFHVEGDVKLADHGTIDFEFSRSVKGTFNDVFLNIGNKEDYTEWQYITSCKEPVLLAMGPDGGLIFADFDECFISVGVTFENENGNAKEALQELADRIDFRILKDVNKPDMRGDSEVPP